MTDISYKFISNITLESIINKLGDGSIYAYASDAVSNIGNPPPSENTNKTFSDISKKLLFGKKVLPSEIFKMIKREEWTSGTTYSMYSDDENLYGKNFFVLNSGRSVYKCLYNNSDQPSIIEPTTLDTSPTELPDGYIWQYMFTLTTNELNDLGTAELIPYIENPTVTQDAVRGSIDHIQLDNVGSGYDYFSTGFISEVVSPNIFAIGNSASPIDDIYVNSSIYIKSGDSSGSISKISAYSSNSSGRYITTVDPMPLITLASEYEINPSIVIKGDGDQALAKSSVNQLGEVTKISILNRGTGYTFAEAELVVNSVFGGSATMTPIISPLLGHGSNVAEELYAEDLQVAVKFEGSELNTIPYDININNIGLITNVRESANSEVSFTGDTFNNTAELTLSLSSGILVVGDIIKSSSGIEGEIIGVNGENILITYNNDLKFVINDNFTSNNGAIGIVTSIDSETNINKKFLNIIYQVNIPTTTRDFESSENFNIIIKAFSS